MKVEVLDSFPHPEEILQIFLMDLSRFGEQFFYFYLSQMEKLIHPIIFGLFNSF